MDSPSNVDLTAVLVPQVLHCPHALFVAPCCVCYISVPFVPAGSVYCTPCIPLDVTTSTFSHGAHSLPIALYACLHHTQRDLVSIDNGDSVIMTCLLPLI